MPLKTMNDLLVTQLKELYAAEKHSEKVLPTLARSASDPSLSAALRTHAQETREHIARLEKVLDEVLEGSDSRPRPTARAETKGMKGLIHDCLDLAKMKNATPPVRDAALIAVAQHVEHDEIAGYGCARTWARLLGHDAAADLLQQTLDQERASDARLTELAESLNETALQAAHG